MSDAQLLDAGFCVGGTAATALAGGQAFQLADGRAAVVAGLKAAAAGDPVAYETQGRFTLTKNPNVVLLDGQEVFWDKTNGYASYTGDFACGVMVGDAASSDTTALVDLNIKPDPVIALNGRGSWLKDEVLGLGVVNTGGTHVLAFDAVAEAAEAAIYSKDTIDVDEGPILEAKLAIYGIGDDAALDINFGLANGTHATDFESVTQFVGFHMDGSSLNINAQSRDGTNTTASTDTTVDAVDDTFLLAQIDCRDKSDCKLYINGVRVLSGSTFNISAITGGLLPIVHVEKTSNDTVADVRVERLHVRTGQRAA